MTDTRFYQALGPISVRALAPSAEIGGDPERQLSGVAPSDRAGPADLCYYESKGKGTPLESAPGACVISSAQAHLAPNAGALILSDRPRYAFAKLATLLLRPRSYVTGGPSIAVSAKLEEGARVGPGVVIGAGAQIGAGTELGPNAVIGPGVAIGRNCRIGANASVQFALVGDGVTILAGAVIGEQGFGVAIDPGGLADVPHFGRVIIQDRAVIGANSTVDRGVFDDTLIAEDVKIDNLCQIAHNCQIGRGTMMASFAGISGSTIVEEGVTMGGRVGIGDHRRIGARAILAGGAAVLQDVPPGETWSGYPAQPIRKWLREVAWLKRKAAGARNGE